MAENLLSREQMEWLERQIRSLVDRKVTILSIMETLSWRISEIVVELMKDSDEFSNVVEKELEGRVKDRTKTIAQERDEEIAKAEEALLAAKKREGKAQMALERAEKDIELANAVRTLFREAEEVLGISELRHKLE